MRSLSILFVGIALTAALHLTSLEAGHGWGGDFAAYIHQAKAIANSAHEPLAELVDYRTKYSTTDHMIGPAYYPWGFPLLLSPVVAVFGDSLPAMRTLIIGFLLGIQVVTFLLLRGRLPDSWNLVTVFLIGISPALVELKNHVHSDIPFWFFTALSLLLIDRYVVKGTAARLSAVRQLILGLCILAAYSIRTHGLALIPTLAFVQLLTLAGRRDANTVRGLLQGVKTAPAIWILPYLVTGIGIFLSKSLGSEGLSSYVSSGHFNFASIGEFISLVATNSVYYLKLPAEFLATNNVLYVVLFAPLVLFGLIKRLRTDYVLIIFVVMHMGILIVFPFRQGIRFILPVLPFYLYFGVAGFFEASQVLSRVVDRSLWVSRSAFLLLLAACVPVLFATAESWSAVADEKPVLSGPYSDASQEMFRYIRDNLEEDSCIVFWKPRVLMFFTGRRSILEYDDQRVFDGRCDYVLTDNFETIMPNNKIQAVISRQRSRLTERHANPELTLYQIID
ncbi:MAG: hypothetical protein OEQ74_02845 [Gammaproteobacteria bacterium]|nr:hypothetical protein [Gammaproteobacteria bacterium]